jgi:hypothetical protein
MNDKTIETAIKICRECQIGKPFSAFCRSSKHRDGYLSACKDCRNAKRRKKYKDNPEPQKTASRIFHQENRAESLRKMRNRYLNNKESYAAVMRKWRTDNAEKLKLAQKEYAQRNREKIRVKMREWKKNNRHLLRAYQEERRTASVMASVKWTNHREIATLYSVARRKTAAEGIQYHVDHMVPIKSPMVQGFDGNLIQKKEFVGPVFPVVQGLHVVANLRVIPAAQNISKLNKFWPDMPNIRL